MFSQCVKIFRITQRYNTLVTNKHIYIILYCQRPYMFNYMFIACRLCFLKIPPALLNELPDDKS